MITKEAIIPKYLTDIASSKLFGIISFTMLTAIAAQFTIPAKPVPFTLQTVMVVLAGAFLGARYGAFSQILYLTAGSIGLPIFAQGSLDLWLCSGQLAVIYCHSPLRPLLPVI